jgi:hypothetical protein
MEVCEICGKVIKYFNDVEEFVKFEKAYNEAYDALSVIEPVDTFDDNGYGEDWKW